MRRIGVFLLVLLLFSLFPVAAEESEELWENFYERLPDAVQDELDEDMESVEEKVGFAYFFSLLTQSFTNAVSENGTAIAKIGGLALALSALWAALGGFGRLHMGRLLWEGLPVLLLFGILSDSMDRAFAALSSLGNFALGAAGGYTALLCSAGAVSSAAVAGGGFTVFVGILDGLLAGLLQPLLKILLAFALCSSFGRVAAVEGLGKRLSAVYLWILSLASVLFAASLAMEGSLASSADSVAVRTVKFAVGSSIPVVGGTVSGALGALGSSLSLVKSTFGAASVIVLLTLLLPPICELLVFRLSLSLAAFAADSTSAEGVGGAFRRLLSLYDLMLAALIIVSLLFLIFIAVLSKTLLLPI